MDKIIKIKPNDKFNNEIMSDYVRLSFQLSKYSYTMPFGTNLNEPLSDGQHRACVACRGNMDYLWFNHVTYDDYFE